MPIRTLSTPFYGWRVVAAAFVLAAFGWGLGFYGPPVFLSVIREQRGWPLALVSTAVTVHFLAGAVSGANLPRLYQRFGAAAVTKGGALLLGLGTTGWALAVAPWQLFVATTLSGVGWGAMSAAAVNAIVAPWFVRARPAALGMAYNGGSVGGIIFSPLWVAAIAALGFVSATAAVGAVMIVTMWILADRTFSRTPQQMGQSPDGDAPGTPPTSVTSPKARPLPGALVWRDIRFLTLAAAMSLVLFAQIGLVAHLFSLLSPTLGAQQAGLAMALVTALAIVGRMTLGWVMPLRADRRIVAAVSCFVQLAGSVVFYLAEGASVPLLLLGVILFGAGFGNATTLPPLIAQVEFVKEDITRIVSLLVGVGQAFYAFAPAVFGLIRDLAPHATAAPGYAPGVFIAATLVQALAIAAFLVGRRA